MQTSAKNQSAINLAVIWLWVGWFTVAVFVIFKMTTQTNYAVMSTNIAADFGLSLGEIGVLGSIYILGFALMTIPAGAMLDFYNPRYVLILSVLTVSLGAVIFATAPNWVSVCVGQFVMGVGGAFGYPALGFFTRHVFGVRRFTFMMAMAGVIGASFSALSQGGVASLLNSYDWRSITLALAAFGVGLAVLMVFVIRDDSREGSKSLPSFARALVRDLKAVVVVPRLWGGALVGGVGFSAYMAFGVVWGVQLLMEQGYEATKAGHIGSLMWIGGAIGAPAIAILNTRLNSYKIPAVTFCLGCAICIAGLCLSSSTYPTYTTVLVLLTGFFGGGSTVLGFGYGMQLCQLHLAGTVTAFVNFFLFVVSGVMMIVPGELIDLGLADSLSQTMLVFPVILTVTAVLVGVFYRDDVLPSEAPN
ncbi:MAG: putative MFS family arabinose efflux permease [Candidatus Pseudothioglobus sp.]|jgi:MFS family permease